MEEDDLKSNILGVICGLLCEQGEVRNIADERRKALEFKPEYPVQLADIIHDSNEAIDERLMCGVMLKEYINQFWEFKTNFCTSEVKATTRTLLSHALGDENVKVVDSAAYLLGIIAQMDYPHTWKQMLSMLTDKLRSQDQRVVIGGVTFLQKCFQKIPDLLQEDVINESMYNFFYGITEQENIYNTTLRTKVVALMTDLIIQDYSKDKDVARVGAMANRFASILGYILNQPYGASSDFQLKAVIVAAFTKFLRTVPEMVGQLILSALPIVWDVLMACVSEYRQIIAVRSDSNAFLQSRVLPLDATEECGYPTHFMSLVDNIFAMVLYVAATEKPFSNYDVYMYMGELELVDIFYSILIFSCATPYTERDIYNSELEYVDEDVVLDDDLPTSYVSVSSNNSFSRVGLRYLLRSVIRSSTDLMKTVTCVRAAIVRALDHTQQRCAQPPPADVTKLKCLEDECDAAAAAQRPAFVPPPVFTPAAGSYDLYTSRVAEGVMYVLCGVAALVDDPDHVQEPMVPLDLPPGLAGGGPIVRLGGENLENLIHGYMKHKVDNSRRLSVYFNVREFLNKYLGIVQAEDVLLNCRLITAAARFCFVFSVDEYKNHLQKILEHLHGNYDICRHAALRALNTHCDYFQNCAMHYDLMDAFRCFVLRFNNCLITMAPFANIDMLNVIVWIITYLLQLNTHAPEQMVEFVLLSLRNHMNNYEFIKSIKLLIEVLTSFVQNKAYFQRELFQRLLDMVRNATSTAVEGQHDRNMDKSVGLYLFSDLLRTVDDPALQLEILGTSLRIVYAALTSGPTDVDVAHNGHRCLSVFFLRVGGQLLHLGPAFTVDSYVTIFEYYLDPSQPEEVCVGLEHPFLAMLVTLHEQFAHLLDAFVKSLLSRVNHAQTLDARDSLMMMFLALFYYYGGPTTQLLDMLPGPDGATSALLFVMPLLLDVHFNSFYTQSLYLEVITRMMRETFISNERRLVDLIVEHNNYSPGARATHVLHNRHVLQPFRPISVPPPIPYKRSVTESVAHTAASSSTIDSDIALPPVYRPAASAGASSTQSMRPPPPPPPPQRVASVGRPPRAVESMDLSYSAAAAATAPFPVPASVPPLDLRSLVSALAQDETESEERRVEVAFATATVPFLNKAFRMLLDVYLANRKADPEHEFDIGNGERHLFPDADDSMDIRTFQPLESLITNIESFVQSFFNDLVNGSCLELFNLCYGLNEAHKHEVQRLMRNA